MSANQPHRDRFRCLRCQGDGLAPASAPGRSEGADGTLQCAVCGASWPIVAGIPRFVAASNYADTFGFQWQRHRRTQLDSFTGLSITRDRVRRTTGWPESLPGETILEAGSGAGRFTEVLLATGAEVYSFDYSAAVDANAANQGRHPGLHLFQADIFDIPVQYQAFDKVFCLGVLQHTPDPERAFRSLATHVRPGGELVVDVYAKRATALVSWKYLLRPLTTRVDNRRLYDLTARVVDALLPAATALRRVGGRLGARLLPIVEHSTLGLGLAHGRDWAVLDTFDMYSPKHDHPRTKTDVRRWFAEVGFESVVVENGPNGVVGRGRRPGEPGAAE